MTPEQLDEVARLLDDLLRSHRSTSIFTAEGRPTAMGNVWIDEIDIVGDAQVATLAIMQMARELPADYTIAPTDFRAFVKIEWEKAGRGRALSPGAACLTCNGDQMVMVGYVQPQESPGRPHVWGEDPAKYDPLRHGLEQWSPCPDCNQAGLIEAREYREKFDRRHRFPSRPSAPATNVRGVSGR